ncbi:hypothetical protein SynBOUM118_00452 [Synechococcus sp. BOUM118]|nr:hypothetical protein SynBOUM118_00452 [Synechococcus sp. BOUM118]
MVEFLKDLEYASRAALALLRKFENKYISAFTLINIYAIIDLNILTSTHDS